MRYKPSELEGVVKNRTFIYKGFDHDFFDWVNHPTLSACNSLCMQNYFKRFFVLRSLEMILSFFIKNSRLKAIKIEIEFFHFLSNHKDRTLDYFCYTSHVRHNPLQSDAYIDELVEIFLKLSMKTVQVHLIIGTTLVMSDITGEILEFQRKFTFWFLRYASQLPNLRPEI